MVDTTINWPKKRRELESCEADSNRWNDFPFREGDVIIATPAKSGTSWMQQIVAQLVFDGKEGLFGGPSSPVSPWVEHRGRPLRELISFLEAQTHRRILKTHLPLDALLYSPKAKYIYVGRDIRDIMWSLHNMEAGWQPAAAEAQAHLAGGRHQRLAFPLDCAREFYLAAMHRLATASSQTAEHMNMSSLQAWWDVRSLPNLLLVHFNNLKADLEREIRRVARFLEIPIKDELMPRIVEHCSFAYMKGLAKFDKALKWAFKNGGDTFFNKGTNGRWREVLSPEEIALADEVAAKYMKPDCAHWLKTGELPG